MPKYDFYRGITSKKSANIHNPVYTAGYESYESEEQLINANMTKYLSK